MSQATIALPLAPECSLQKRKRASSARSLVETGGSLSGINGFAGAKENLAKVTTHVSNAVEIGGKKAASAATAHGLHKTATLCLKVAAAAPVIAKVIVAVAVVFLCVCLFRIFRAA
jgi:hypothetical protein